MNLAILVFVTVIGFVLYFEGFTRNNPFIAWTGAIMLMFTGTDLYINGLTIQSGFTYNILNNSITTATINYTPIDIDLTQTISRLLFYIGYFGLAFPALQVAEIKTEIKKKEKEI